MPKNKDVKRLVRSRMRKTGESYTTARSQLLKTPKTEEPLVDRYARLSGYRNETVAEKTGCGWDKWVYVLDRVNASEKTHREIAKYISEKYKVSGWWAQSITVGYERIKGLREIGQRRSGSFEANKSKTIGVPVTRLYNAFSQKRTRIRWLGEIDLQVRTSSRNKSMRILWPDNTRVDVYFTEKDENKSQVAVQHRSLTDRAAIPKMKEFWAAKLRELSDLLTS